MTPAEYFDSIKERLLTDEIVTAFQIRRERHTVVDGHIRVRASIVDGSLLEFSEYAVRLPEDQMQVVVYSYHWEDAAGNLICRWDNTPHFPGMPGFPHHVHDGKADAVLSGRPVDIFVVLDWIRQALISH